MWKKKHWNKTRTNNPSSLYSKSKSHISMPIHRAHAIPTCQIKSSEFRNKSVHVTFCTRLTSAERSVQGNTQICVHCKQFEELVTTAYFYTVHVCVESHRTGKCRGKRCLKCLKIVKRSFFFCFMCKFLVNQVFDKLSGHRPGQSPGPAKYYFFLVGKFPSTPGACETVIDTRIIVRKSQIFSRRYLKPLVFLLWYKSKIDMVHKYKNRIKNTLFLSLGSTLKKEGVRGPTL